jgi:hypothetical protein
MVNVQKEALDITRKVLQDSYGYTSDVVAEDKMFVVWSCKTLQNWKAIVGGTNIKELIEVTYNGDTKEAYVDVYDKKLNVAIKLGGE